MQNFHTHNTKPPDVWQVYEERKKQIIQRNLPYKEYEQAIKQLVKELAL